MQYIYIQDEDSLSTYCFQAAQAKFLAIDTEFVRTRTLYPRLGLLQVYDGNQLALIDPIAIKNLSSFWALLNDPKLLKVLHACSEDLEVFLTQANCKPENMLDSQIAMAFLGHGLSLGYAATINHFLEIELDKSESRTDWMKRPLSKKQLDYAAADVWYLWQVTDTIVEQLKQKNWYEAAFAESQQLIEKKFSDIDSDLLFTDVKMAWQLSPEQLNRLKFLCRWRFKQAQIKDVPISFIAKDATLMLLAKRNPNSVGAMANYEGVEVLDVRHQGKAMLAVLRKAAETQPIDYPSVIQRLDDYPGYKQIFKAVKNIVNKASTVNDLTPEFLASKKQINQFLTWYWQLNHPKIELENVDVMRGWRKTIIGETMLNWVENERN